MNYIEELKQEHDGKYITCYIEGIRIADARIKYVTEEPFNGQFFICQNKKKGSDLGDDKWGYNFSWTVSDGSALAIENHNVSKLVLVDNGAEKKGCECDDCRAMRGVAISQPIYK